MEDTAEGVRQIISVIANYSSRYPYDDGLEVHDNFIDLPLWKRQLETQTRPDADNRLNGLIETFIETNKVCGKGVDLAIERYGLSPRQQKEVPEPSTSRASSEPDNKKRKTDPNLEDILMSAVGSAISEMGIMQVQH